MLPNVREPYIHSCKQNITVHYSTLLRDEQVHTPSVFNIVSSSTSYILSVKFV